MEMSISNNQSYLESFYHDLQTHRFGMIVIEKQKNEIDYDREMDFSEENNAWVENITIPLLESYTEVRDYPICGTILMVPKD
jgi:hypothetical protein